MRFSGAPDRIRDEARPATQPDELLSLRQGARGPSELIMASRDAVHRRRRPRFSDNWIARVSAKLPASDASPVAGMNITAANVPSGR